MFSSSDSMFYIILYILNDLIIKTFWFNSLVSYTESVHIRNRQYEIKFSKLRIDKTQWNSAFYLQICNLWNVKTFLVKLMFNIV